MSLKIGEDTMSNKNWQCGACVEFTNGYCQLHKRSMKAWELCPDWKAIWEEI